MKLPTLLLLLCLSCPALAQLEDSAAPVSKPLQGNVSQTDLGGEATDEQRLEQWEEGGVDSNVGASDNRRQSPRKKQQLNGSADTDSLPVGVDQQTAPFLKPANHGEIAVGVIGYTFDNDSGKILVIHPGSDLPKHGVKVGDYVVSVNGHLYDPMHPRAEPDRTIGTPGTIVHMVFKRNGHEFTADVERRDSRFFVGNPSSDGYYEWAAAQTRRW